MKTHQSVERIDGPLGPGSCVVWGPLPPAEHTRELIEWTDEGGEPHALDIDRKVEASPAIIENGTGRVVHGGVEIERYELTFEVENTTGTLSAVTTSRRDGGLNSRYTVQVGPTEPERRAAAARIMALCESQDPGPLHYALAAYAFDGTNGSESIDAGGRTQFIRAIAGVVCDELSLLGGTFSTEVGSQPIDSLDALWARLVRKHSPDHADEWKEIATGRSEDSTTPADRWRAWFSPHVAPIGSLVLSLLAESVARKLVGGWLERQERARKIPAPSLPHPIAQTFALAAVATELRRPTGPTDLQFSAGPGWCQSVPASAMIQVAGAVTRPGSQKLLAPLASFLSRQAHRKWVNGARDHNIVTLAASCNRASDDLSVRVANLDDLIGALEWLRCFDAAGYCAINGFRIDKLAPPGKRGGRPYKQFVIEVGSPLSPHALVKLYKDRGVMLPINFYAPVFDPSATARAGNRKTYAAQYAAASIGIGALLIEHRTEYAQQGIRFDRVFREELRAMGLYQKRFPSLVDETISAWIAPNPSQLWGPFFEPVEPGSDRYRLGKYFEEQDAMIIEAAAITERWRKGGPASNKRKP